MTEIERCLSCTRPRCDGDYPNCLRPATNTLSDVSYGSLNVYVCNLAKQGYKRHEIAKICGMKSKNVASMLHYGMIKNLISREMFDATRTDPCKVNKRYV